MKLFLLFSHQLTNEQKSDLKSYGVTEVVALTDDLQKLWSAVPPEMGEDELLKYAKPFQSFLSENAQKGDWVLASGDFGLTFVMANWCYDNGLRPVYATTRREVVEVKDGDKVVKRSQFKHVRFREFPKA